VVTPVIVLDTNVISELMRPTPTRVVVDWVDQQPAGDLYLTSVTIADLLYGVARLAEGRRRAVLAEQVDAMINEDFQRRILSFDLAAAPHYADMAVHRAALGQPISTADAQIAATCRSHDAKLATRNTKDFARLNLQVINPWRP
jgi:predicted nucleic acid-binding protein